MPLDENLISDAMTTAVTAMCKQAGASLSEQEIAEIRTLKTENIANFRKIAKIYHDTLNMDEKQVLNSLVRSSQTSTSWSAILDIPEVQQRIEHGCRTFGRGLI